MNERGESEDFFSKWVGNVLKDKSNSIVAGFSKQNYYEKNDKN